MILKLTLKQRIEYYAIVGLVLITPIISLFFLFQIHFGEYSGKLEEKELIVTSIPFLIIAIIFYLIRKIQLKFTEIPVSLTDEEFIKAIEISSQKLEWRIEKQSNKYLRSFRGPDFLGSEMITIHREKDKVLINCIPNPNHKASLLTFGLRKAHIKTFTGIILKIKEGIPIVDEPEKLTVGDIVLRIIGYTFCLIFIGLSIFLLIPNGNYFLGLFVGLIGLMILLMDLRKIIKNASR